MKRLILTTAVTAAALMASAAEANVALVTQASDTILTQEACQRQAFIGMRKAGFVNGIESQGQSVFGNYQQYVATIRCFTMYSLVVFVVAGPNKDNASALLSTIVDAFKTPI